jgi:hypothetical protein
MIDLIERTYGCKVDHYTDPLKAIRALTRKSYGIALVGANITGEKNLTSQNVVDVIARVFERQLVALGLCADENELKNARKRYTKPIPTLELVDDIQMYTGWTKKD